MLKTHGQSKTTAWMDYNLTYRIGKDVLLYGDLGHRFTDLNSSIQTTYIRPGVRFDISRKLEFHGGIGLFAKHNAFNELLATELRPWQGVRLRWPSFDGLKIKHFVRFEERFNSETFNWKVEPTVRFRYQLGLNLPIWTEPYGEQELYMPCSYELLHEFDSQHKSSGLYGGDRFDLGMAYRISATWTLELHYMHLRNSDDGYSELEPASNLLRMRVRHRIF